MALPSASPPPEHSCGLVLRFHGEHNTVKHNSHHSDNTVETLLLSLCSLSEAGVQMDK